MRSTVKERTRAFQTRMYHVGYLYPDGTARPFEICKCVLGKHDRKRIMGHVFMRGINTDAKAGRLAVNYAN